MKLILGDSLQKLKDFPTNTVDAVVTDAPYGLGKEPCVRNVLRQWLDDGHAQIGGKGFMGKEWDAFVPQPALWAEVFRVMKPGAHIVAFFGTRTYDWGVMSMRLAGFEVRDQVQWLYGSGFPKSLAVDKAIDKMNGDERPVTGKASRPSGLHRGKIADYSPKNDDNFEPLITSAASAAWQGFGTALKPANEPIVLARKPLEKGLTVAENVLKWGTGALAIDASRIAHNEECRMMAPSQANIENPSEKCKQAGRRESVLELKPNGRWPANVLFDEEAAQALDEQSGACKTGAIKPYKQANRNSYSGSMPEMREVNHAASSGGASRFFYVAKTSKKERNEGLAGLAVHRYGAGIGQGKDPEAPTVDKNFHPTVKPIKLMEYLCRLITPPGGIILDPFLGSGSTLCAAARLGFQGIGIEREAEYMEIAKRRIEHWSREKQDEQLSLDGPA